MISSLHGVCSILMFWKELCRCRVSTHSNRNGSFRIPTIGAQNGSQPHFFWMRCRIYVGYQQFFLAVYYYSYVPSPTGGVRWTKTSDIYGDPIGSPINIHKLETTISVWITSYDIFHRKFKGGFTTKRDNDSYLRLCENRLPPIPN